MNNSNFRPPFPPPWNSGGVYADDIHPISTTSPSPWEKYSKIH